MSVWPWVKRLTSGGSECPFLSLHSVTSQRSQEWTIENINNTGITKHHQLGLGL
jgi:hypothetical protein